MKEGCRLEVKFTHTFFDDDYIQLNDGNTTEIILKTKNWFIKNKFFLEDENGDFPKWGLSSIERFKDKVVDIYGHIGYVCMIDEIKEKYYQFVLENDLFGRNYKVEYMYRFVPMSIHTCIHNLKFSIDVPLDDYTDIMEKLFKRRPFKEIEDYILGWKRN